MEKVNITVQRLLSTVSAYGSIIVLDIGLDCFSLDYIRRHIEGGGVCGY